MSFITLPQHSIALVAQMYYTFLCTITKTEKQLSAMIIENHLAKIVRFWQNVHNKLEYDNQTIHSLFSELLQKSDISVNEFVGKCISQWVKPTSDNMKTFMKFLFHSFKK